MPRSLSSILPWLALAAAVALLSTTTISFAGSGDPEPEPAPEAVDETVTEAPLVVPEVTGQPYVFAKGILEDAGFAWKVTGKIEGYPGNTVAEQEPSAGTEVHDTGAPTIVLRLKRNKDYEQRGVPQGSSPYEGTRTVLVSETLAEPAAPAPTEPAPAEPAADESEGSGEGGPDVAASNDASQRPPAFIEPGAPPEPLEEITLVERARNLAADLADGSEPDKVTVDHWLYQHSWIVTGAQFGWYGGVEALQLLIEIDDDLQARWGIGAQSAQVARDALADVARKTAEGE